MKKVLVTGAGGFIGTHVVRHLKKLGYWVRGVDLKHPRWSVSPADEFWLSDLRRFEDALSAVTGVSWICHLAADMGGIQYISGAHFDIASNNTAIDSNVLRAAHRRGVQKLFFSSSACVYPQFVQDTNEDVLLKEEDVYPAMPEGAYGWEKLHTEHLCKYYQEMGHLKTYVARLHNCYGQEGSWEAEDRRAKAPAELCRKVAIAKLAGHPEVEVWGGGEQKRSFMWIDDCVTGIIKLMESDFHEPLNLGRARVVTINELVDIIADIAGIKVIKKYVPGPQGVRSRSSDNSLCKRVLGWEPETPLEEGLIPTYRWIKEQVKCTIS